MNTPRIVGLVLVRDEDRFLHRVVTNIAEFCDEILLVDHGSRDGTWEIAEALARTHPHVRPRRIAEVRESNALLAPFVATPTWIFAVDGDEIYDPAGLARLRPELLAGKYDPWWVVFGNVLNCVALDPAQQTASGYLAPPCRSMTKLYNFRLLRALDENAPQRLHGRDEFQPGFHRMLRYDLYKETAWEDAHFRCLHTCFLPRSSRAPENLARENITESLDPIRRVKRFLRRLLGRVSTSDYKRAKYRRGPQVTVDSSPFFP